MTVTRPRGRRPGPGETREDILAAARELFAEQGYERASLRAIARRAKVDPALIIHFFSSKEGLLREVLTLPLDPAAVLGRGLADVPDDRVGTELVRVVLGVWENEALQPRLISLFRTAVSHELAMTMLRQTMQRTVIAAVSRLVDDETAQRRAELVATQMAGLAMARYLVRLPGISAMTPDELADAVGPCVQHYLTDPL